MAINTGKVVVGGLAAGVVMNAIDFAANMFVFGEKMKAEMDAVNPSMSAAMNGTNAMVTFIVCDFVIAFLVVWTYAAIRPRFGPGAGTAVKAGVLLWLVSGLAWSSWTLAGVITPASMALAAGVALVNMLVSANVGAMIYKED